MDDIQTENEGGDTLNTVENLVYTMTTDDNGEAKTKKIPTGRYYIQEIESPKNYALDKTKYEVNLTTGHNTLETAIVCEVEDKPSDVVINKIESSSFATNGTQLSGAELQIFVEPESGNVDYSSEPVYSFTTTNEPKELIGVLEVGKTYVLHEKKSPDGFTKAPDKEFTVSEDGSKDEVTMTDSTTIVPISKVDVSGTKEVIGAHLKLEELDGTLIDEWVSEKEPHLFEGVLIAGREYRLTETLPADGYVTAESVTFTVSETGPTPTVYMRDDTVKIDISKVDAVGGEEIEGAHLEIHDKSGTVLEQWISGTTPHRILYPLKVNETYTLIETIPADGYATATAVDFVVNDTKEVQKVVMKDEPLKIEVSKQDITGTEELKGACLEIKDENGAVLESWISGDTPHMISTKLKAGSTYTLSETYPADGFATANDILFTVLDTENIQVVTMKDEPTTVEFKKTDITGTKEVIGAHLKLKDIDGNLIEEWISEKEPHIIQGKLIADYEYILTETLPADGFATAESVIFKVSDTGKIQTVIMKDDVTKVEISKVDATNSEEIEGAQLEVQDMNGKVIDKWVSEKKPHIIKGILVVNQEYRLIEKIPADGYATAHDIVFKVLDTGKVQSVVMEDDPTCYEFIKKAKDTGKVLAGAKFVLSEYQKDGKGKKIAEFTSAKEPIVIVGKLVVGKSYILTETKAPKDYETAEPYVFTVKDTGEKQTVIITDEAIILPKTGGESTSGFLISLGITLMLAGVFIFLFSKRSFN